MNRKKEDLSWLLCSGEPGKSVRELKRRKSSFMAEFPNMVLQLTLLLNAGLILDAAFGELLADKGADSHILYRLLAEIRERCLRTNASFTAELYRLAGRSRQRDLIRFATLLAEHQGRGSALAGRLEREKDHLWAGRLASARASAREAETRLCFPLMLLLLAIVIISIAPALLEMR